MKITNAYRPDSYLQACDVVRLVRAVRELPPDPVFTPLAKFIALACKDCGWNESEILAAITEL